MTNKTKEMMQRALDCGLVPMLEGSPGIGKTSYTRETAADFNLKLIDVRLPTLDPTDISGIPMRVMVDLEDGTQSERVRHVPSTLFPLQGDALPLKLDANGKPYYVEVTDAAGKVKKELARYDGWLIAFEEITSCVPAMQAAAYRVLLEREVGESKLHDAVEMVATGNKASDKAVVIPMSTAMRTRLCFIEVEPNHTDWINWAYSAGIDSRIISYLQWRPNMLHAFDPNIKQLNCPVGRTWEFASRLLKNDTGSASAIDPITSKLLYGVIGQTAAEFCNFLAVYSSLPDIAAIIKDPANADLPAGDSHQYALASVLAAELAKDGTNTSGLITYIQRMNKELQTVAMLDTFRINRKMLRNPDVSAWTTANTNMINASI